MCYRSDYLQANRLLSAIDLHRSETEVIQEHRAKYERHNQPVYPPLNGHHYFENT